ncbi:ADP-ribosyltransferase exoenzyme [Actinomadura pelletieri DSM 43383]|uniref:ADP-ribosyltransferase exoenzyme n=1 Tax=Actinomadura pelletieri DSM 43383 TaxID=1120940 RepID=A0A495QP32_9ACTN|nr:ADP-ribosyltransferase [Actinomadura pelletieri]RKS74735.1 ADP-ribosyltransferase exoenzyme [Actinomadura pelletieri DSM 43383]
MIVPDEVLGIMAKVHPDAVEAEAHDLRKAATGIREAGSDVHTTWQGLSAFYKAPEAGQLFAATAPVRDDSAMFAGQLEKVTGALTTYAAETRVIKHKLTDLYMRAVTFVNKTYAEKDDWQKNEDLVRENNTLIAAVDAQAMAFHNAQEKATHTIYAAYGETAPALPTGGGGDQERPWGTPEEADLPWYHDAWNGGTSLLKGFFGDGFWGDVSGIWDLVTSPGKWFESYKSLMALTLPLNPIVAPFAMLVPSVRRKVHETWKGFGKSFVAWDRWKQDPARAFGNTAYNVVTSIIPIGKAGSAGKLGKFSHGAAKVGEAVDPVGLTVRASVTLPKVADITAALSGKIGDFTTATKLNLDRFVIKPAIDLKAYALSKTANIPDRIPDWVLRRDGAEAAAQVRAAHTPDLVGARTGQPTTVQDSPGGPTPPGDRAPGNGSPGVRAPEGGQPDATPAGEGAGSGPGDPPPPDRNGDGFDQQGPQQGGQGTPDQTPDGDGSSPDGPDSNNTNPLPGHMDPDGIRRFDTDDAGQEYGDRHLSDQYRNLPPDQAHAIREYTRHSWPYNPHLRGLANIQDSLRTWYNNVGPGWPIFEMNGGRPPSVSDIFDATRRTDLTPDQRRIVDDIVQAGDPHKRLEEWIRASGSRGIVARTFDGFPTVADFRERIRLIDQALSHHLPEGIQVQRGLHDVSFMDGYNGTMTSLRGSIETERSFMSTALGEKPPEIDGNSHPIVMHLDVPPGSRGLWMGRESNYPAQRELILPRNTRYRINNVYKKDGIWHIEAEVLDTPVNNGL